MKVLSITTLEAILWSLTALDMSLTAGRVFMHWRNLKKIRLDDVFNIAAVIFLLVFMITWQKYVPIELPIQLYAAGKIDTPPSVSYDPLDALKNDFANLVVFWCTIYSVKASFLALYWQIFEISRRFRIAWTALTVYVVLSCLVTILSVFWHCGNPSTLIDLASCKRWKPRAITIMYIGAVLHILGDLLMMALPMVMLRNLHMRRREKIGLMTIFALVLINVCFAILRVVFTVKTIAQKDSDENTLWTSLDPIVAVLVCTLPCYRAILSSGRTNSIVRTVTSSFGSLRFGRTIRNSSTRKGSILSSTEMDDLSTRNLPMHGATLA